MVSLQLQDDIVDLRSHCTRARPLALSGFQATDWAPSSWQQRVALQQPGYEDAEALTKTITELAQQPTLVTAHEVVQLKLALAQAQEGRSFLLQGGDCAESFSECTTSIITDRLQLLLQMGLILMHGLQQPVIRVGRFAGQYAKPRSADTESRNGVTLPVFRGDSVNRPEFNEAARRPDPRRLLEAHARSALTMNMTRALAENGLAHVYQPSGWDLDWLVHSPLESKHRRLIGSISESLQFIRSLGETDADNEVRTAFHTSHEALLLHYEEAQTRYVPGHGSWFNLSTHFPWIGVRTAALEGAHVEYLRGISNPVAVKVGPSTQADELLRLIDTLNPHNEPGRLTLITRMGHPHIAQALPALLRAVSREGQRVLWICDPMHGNTETLASGYKTRRFDNILGELDQAFDIHAAHGTHLGGVHLEISGDDVTECLGGARALNEEQLSRNYKSCVDPRLNREQSLELALMVVHKAQRRTG
ncbi:class II 3-deoxy-7-phosphoheptulonate synthase [Pseudomonas fluorescens]|uniref:class II 3-deoxy-7-phosphoheptulonate synthase n=1 Tax=Pseudomonas fluorescens TaxID=294 RepID=UPI001784A669|nr:3-deoxy-7-phosphoheptulonate synthase class II [Pseudomonas fluorescens]